MSGTTRRELLASGRIKLLGGGCSHERNLIVTSVGVRRSICQECGHVSFKMHEVVTTIHRFDKRTELPKVSGL